MESSERRWSRSVLAIAVVAVGCDGASTHGGAAKAAIGAMASATLATVPGGPVSSADGQPVAGSATFRGTRDGVDAVVTFNGCILGQYYAARFYDTPDCTTALAQVGQGDYADRDGIAKVSCTGTSGFAHFSYSRSNEDPRPWTIADQPSSENVVGKVLVLETRNAPVQALACGKVARAPDQPPAGPLPPVEVAGQLAGFCTWSSQVAVKTADCPKASTFVDCADVHCDVTKCNAPCADLVTCVEGLTNACDVTGVAACPVSDACNACRQDLQGCAVNFCLTTLGCSAPPTPGGPCTKLEQCCAKQGDAAEGCLDSIRLLAQTGGDVSCASGMNDWDFNAHLKVPCDWSTPTP